MIELNKVGIEIDGKVYEMRKMNFGFQRRMIALQTAINDTHKRLSKKYDVSIDKLDGVITNEELLVSSCSDSTSVSASSLDSTSSSVSSSTLALSASFSASSSAIRF